MPGRVEHLETELGALDHRAFVDEPVGRDDGLVLLRDLGVGEHLGAGRLHEALGARRVVGMGVGEQHPAHPLAHRSADDRVDVLRVVGTRVDHRDLVDADEVGVGPRAGHRPRVRRHDPAHQRRERARHARREVGHQADPRLRSAARIACSVGTGDRAVGRFDRVVVAGVPREQEAGPVAVGDDAGLGRGREIGSVTHDGDDLRRGLEPGERLEAPSGREDELQLAGVGTFERVGRSDPGRCHRLAVVVEVGVALRRLGHEEPGVVPTGHPGRGDPVREEVEPVDVEHEVLRGEHVEEPPVPPVHRRRAPPRDR